MKFQKAKSIIHQHAVVTKDLVETVARREALEQEVDKLASSGDVAREVVKDIEAEIRVLEVEYATKLKFKEDELEVARERVGKEPEELAKKREALSAMRVSEKRLAQRVAYFEKDLGAAKAKVQEMSPALAAEKETFEVLLKLVKFREAERVAGRIKNVTPTGQDLGSFIPLGMAAEDVAWKMVKEARRAREGGKVSGAMIGENGEITIDVQDVVEEKAKEVLEKRAEQGVDDAFVGELKK